MLEDTFEPAQEPKTTTSNENFGIVNKTFWKSSFLKELNLTDEPREGDGKNNATDARVGVVSCFDCFCRSVL